MLVLVAGVRPKQHNTQTSKKGLHASKTAAHNSKADLSRKEILITHMQQSTGYNVGYLTSNIRYSKYEMTYLKEVWQHIFIRVNYI